MLSSVISKDMIEVNVDSEGWKDAIKKGTELLLNKGYIDYRYEGSIIKNFERFGDYMVLEKGIVLAHARPEEGVKKIGISLVTLKYPIKFNNEENNPIKLIITLAVNNNNSHIEILKSLTNLLKNEEDVELIKSSNNKLDVLNIISKY